MRERGREGGREGGREKESEMFYFAIVLICIETGGV